MMYLRCAAIPMLLLMASRSNALVVVLYGWTDGSLRVVSLRNGITTFEVECVEMIPKNLTPGVLTARFDSIDEKKLFKTNFAAGFHHASFGNVLPAYRSIYEEITIRGSVIARNGQRGSLKQSGLVRLIIPADPLAMIRFVVGWLSLF